MVRSAVLLAALALAFSACSDGSGGVVEDPGVDIATNELPYGSGVEVGESYDYVLYVHCGVRWARLDGVWWETDLLADTNGNPPRGWGNPYHEGTMTILDESTANYVGGPEMTVRFKRTDLIDAPFSCR